MKKWLVDMKKVVKLIVNDFVCFNDIVMCSMVVVL